MSGKDNDTPATSRDKALAELKRQISDQRARIDPALLARAAAALGGKETASVPYDRTAATRAIELFIAAHKEKADFKARLFSFIQKQSH